MVKYFDDLQNRRFANAYELVSEARKQERAKDGADHFIRFQQSFDNTFGYDNVAVTFEITNGRERKYSVSYDVIDSVPSNDIFERKGKLYSSSDASEILNQEEIFKLLVGNLRRYYVISDDVIDAIKKYIGTKTINDIFDPIFISKIASDLRDDNKIDLKIAIPHPESIRVKRHFLHDIIMVKEDTAWKIRSGLANPVIANYR